jgi:hypothetical protein
MKNIWTGVVLVCADVLMPSIVMLVPNVEADFKTQLETQ